MITKLIHSQLVKSICMGILLSTAVMSCKKEKSKDDSKLITEVGPTPGGGNPTTPVTTSKCSISKVESYSSENASALNLRSSSVPTYDSEGRVVKEEIQNNGGSKVTMTYAYAADKFTVTTSAPLPIGDQVEEYDLDAIGRIVKYVNRSHDTENRTDYVYNSEGYLSQKIAYTNMVLPNGTVENLDKMVTVYTYLNGNLIKTEGTGYAMGVKYEGPTFVVNFEYDTSKPFEYLNGYNFWQTEGAILPLVKYKNGSTLFGKISTNRLTARKEVKYDNRNQAYDLVRSYTYTMDDKSNTLTMTESSDDKGTKSAKESRFTYTCE